MRVDFPAPFSPTSAWISPLLTWKVTFWSALTPGNSLLMPFISRMKSSIALPLSLARRSLLSVHLPLLEIAALDEDVVEVVLGDDDGLQEHGRDRLLVVEDRPPLGVDGLAVGEVDRHLDGPLPELAGVLEDRHALRALRDADGARELGVLAGDGDLAGEPLRCERLDGSACRAVVRGQHRVHLV